MIKHVLWGCLALVALVPLSAHTLGLLEGRAWPVAGPVVIDEVHEYKDGWTYFSMSGPKHRSCNWRGTYFFLGKRGNGSVPVRFEHLDPPEVRGVGALRWANSRIQVPPEQLLSGTYANTLHDCGWLLWLTETRFYN